jgi:hypothetical protein
LASLLGLAECPGKQQLRWFLGRILVDPHASNPVSKNASDTPVKGVNSSQYFFNSLVKIATIDRSGDRQSATLLLGLSPHALFSKALSEKQTSTSNTVERFSSNSVENDIPVLRVSNSNGGLFFQELA